MNIVVHRLLPQTKEKICVEAMESKRPPQHSSSAAIEMIEAAMFEAECEKAGVFDNKEADWGKAILKRETKVRRDKTLGYPTEDLEREIEIVRRWLAPKPGRQKGKTAKPRGDGMTRLAERISKALKGCGISCLPSEARQYGKKEKFGWNLLCQLIAVVYGPLDDEGAEKIRNAIKR